MKYELDPWYLNGISDIMNISPNIHPINCK